MTHTPLLACQNLQVGYGGHPLLPAINAEIRRGEFWVVIGRNGSGKSTWFKTLLGLVPPVAGQVARPTAGTRLAYFPQAAQLDKLYPARTKDVVAMGLERGRSFITPRFRTPKIVTEEMANLDISHLAHRPFRQLSEGQKARVLLARLAVSSPDLALLDEPTAAMDVVAERAAFEELDKLRESRNMAVVVVSHYLGIAADFATHAVFFDRDCNSVVVGTPRQVFEHAEFHRAYGDVGTAHLHGHHFRCDHSEIPPAQSAQVSHEGHGHG